ncbi:MAG: Tfp pilus assembly protein FimT/FimU [Nitrospinaceae bacterium]
MPQKKGGGVRPGQAGGFTLIELISVMLMLGIVAALAVPTFNTASIDVETAAQAVRADIRFTQQLAVGRNPAAAGDIGITFTPGATSYTVPDPSGIFNTTRNLPNNVTVSSVTIPGAPTANALSFNRYGEPEITLGAQAVIQIQAGGQTKTLTVQQFTGRVTLS